MLFLSVCAGDALSKDAPFGGVRGEREGATIGGQRLIGAPEFPPEIGASGVVQVIAVEFAASVSTPDIAGRGPDRYRSAMAGAGG